MSDTSINVLYDHYKETYNIIATQIEKRNKYFIFTFIVILIQLLFAVSPYSFVQLIIEFVNEEYKIDISNQFEAIQTFMWILLAIVTLRYYQTHMFIERTYSYIHALETQISEMLHEKFDRESTNYLKDYPIILNFCNIIYKFFFPSFSLVVLICKYISEYINHNFGLYLIADSLLFVICVTLNVTYLIFNFKTDCPIKTRKTKIKKV